MPVIEKCLYCMKSHPVQSVLAQFCPIKTMSQPLCFDIDYWRSYGQFLSNKLQLITITSRHYCVTLLNAIPYQKLSHWHDFQPHHPPFISTIHMPVFINQLLSAVLLKSTIVIFFIFNFAWTAQNSKKLATYTVHRVVRENLNYGLRVCRIFSCVVYIF